MSFLVAFNGQFSPINLRVEGIYGGVSQVRPVNPINTIQEKNKVEAYKNQEKSFQQQKKREHARDIMKSPVIVIPDSASADEAMRLMEKYGFRHLPVINNLGIIIGMISDRELIGAVENKKCKEIMVQKVIVSEEQTSINEIAIILLNEKLNALPIVNIKKEVSGIITQSDILNYVIATTGLISRH